MKNYFFAALLLLSISCGDRSNKSESTTDDDTVQTQDLKNIGAPVPFDTTNTLMQSDTTAQGGEK